jgi:hypothetical protein
MGRGGGNRPAKRRFAALDYTAMLPASPPASHKNRALRRTGVALAALLLAISLTALVDAFTAVMPPRWDPESYTDMARNGLLGNDKLVAPFAYRPGVPLLAGALSRHLDISVDDAFLWITRCAIIGLLFATFLLARRFAGDRPEEGSGDVRALIPVFFAAAAVMPVKFSLFVPTSIDSTAYFLIVLAVWAHTGGHRTLAFWISALGLFFKEFLAIPLLLSLVKYHRAWKRSGSRRALWTFGGAVAVSLAVILVPRLGLPVVETHNIHSLSRLIANPLNMLRNLNIVLDLLAFWLPVLLLLTRPRLRSVWNGLAAWRGYLGAFLALDLLLVMYGGTNLMTFVSYMIPVQIIVLARLASAARENPGPGEWLLALCFTVACNRVFGTIPFPDDGFDAYIDYYAGWSSRVNLATLARFGEIAFYLAAMRVARRFVFSRTKPPLLPGA